MRRRLLGSLVGVASVAALGAVMVPFRPHVAVSTVALVLVVPVVAGSVVGGFYAGVASVTAGFLVYDFVFVPPYGTLFVGSTQNWIALAVYAAVMVLVASVVANLDSSRSARRRSDDVVQRLSELAEHLVGDRPVDELLRTIVETVHRVFEVPGVSLLVLDGGSLHVAASAGEALSPEELHRLDPHSGLPVSVGTAPGPDGLRAVALTASGRAVGILALRGLPPSAADRAAFSTFANDAALALERARLREQALRSQLLEEADRIRQGLMGAVSHDLHTPLATIKVASSTLANRFGHLSADATHELHQLIDLETDRLTRLVANLLDMTRIESGVFRVRRVPTPVPEIVRGALEALGPTLDGEMVKQVAIESLPDVDVDQLLVGQVLVNLLDNAVRHSPPGGVVTVAGELRQSQVLLSVSDQGPGVAPEDRESVFNRFTRLDTGGRAGLGLTIAKTFIEAHGECIWCEDAPGGGARFVFTLPTARYPDGD